MKSFAIICIINIFPDNLSAILVVQEDNINANSILILHLTPCAIICIMLNRCKVNK